MLFSGVRELVRHVGKELGLVLGRQGQLLGFFFQGLAGHLDFAVLLLDLRILLRQQFRLLFEFLVGLLQLFLLAAFSRSSEACSERACSCSRVLVSVSSSWRVCSSVASDCDCLSSSSVRIVAVIVFSTMPMLSVSWSRNVRWMSLNRWNEASSMYGFDLSFEQDRQHDDVQRRALRRGRN